MGWAERNNPRALRNLNPQERKVAVRRDSERKAVVEKIKERMRKPKRYRIPKGE